MAVCEHEAGEHELAWNYLMKVAVFGAVTVGWANGQECVGNGQLNKGH